MNGYYKGKIKVVGADLQCFPAHAETLEPLACGSYDPWAWIDPDPEPVETIGVAEWNRRRDVLLHNAVLSRRTGGEAEKNETADPVRSA